MYEDPVRWGGMFQSYSQLTMLDLHTQPHVSLLTVLLGYIATVVDLMLLIVDFRLFGIVFYILNRRWS